MSAAPAVLALAEEFEPVRQNGHPRRAGHASGQGLQPARLEVQDAPAVRADRVVVVADPAGEVAVLAILAMDFLDQAVADQEIQRAVDGGQPDADPALPGRAKDLAGGEALGRRLDHPENGLARPRQAIALPAQGREHLADEGGPHGN